MTNAFQDLAIYRTKDEVIRLRNDGTFTEGYSSLSEFKDDPGFRVEWEFNEIPVTQDYSWERLTFLWSDEDQLADSLALAKEASQLKTLWEVALRHSGSGWKLGVRTGTRPRLEPATSIGGSGRDRGLNVLTPECSQSEIIRLVNDWLKYQANVDRFMK